MNKNTRARFNAAHDAKTLKTEKRKSTKPKVARSAAAITAQLNR